MEIYLKKLVIILPIAVVIYTLLYRLDDTPTTGKWKKALKMGLITGFLSALIFAFMYSADSLNLSKRIENTVCGLYLVFIGILGITIKCLRRYQKRKQVEVK